MDAVRFLGSCSVTAFFVLLDGYNILKKELTDGDQTGQGYACLLFWCSLPQY